MVDPTTSRRLPFVILLIFCILIPAAIHAGLSGGTASAGAAGQDELGTNPNRKDNPLDVEPAALTTSAPLTFTHGLASGDVTHSSAVLWTHVNQTATLIIEVALDPSFAQIVFQGAITANEAGGYSTKVNATSLQANQTHYYRWLNTEATSQVGQFKTAPTPNDPAAFRFAYSGDSDGTRVLEQPFYNNFEVLDAARQEDLDFFIYLGDIIYSDSSLRDSGPATTLDEYRQAYLTNREVQALPDLLAATSTYVIWDDHEVYNDYDGQTVDPARYAAGRQAFMDSLPIEDSGFPSDPTCAGDPLFQTFSWGRQADFIVLDERSCRSADVSDQCEILGGLLPDPAPTLPQNVRNQFGLVFAPPEGCLDAINDPSRTFLGPVQKQLFKDALLNSTATYKFIVNELPIQQIYVLPYDRWEGYAAERTEILNFIRDNQIENVIFLTTDIHANVINEVFIDNFTDPQPIAYDFVTGPIATSTMGEVIDDVLPIFGIGLANDLFDLVGVDCRQLDAYAYALVESNPGQGTLTISLKDENGDILLDQQDDNISCTKTFDLGLAPQSYAPSVSTP